MCTEFIDALMKATAERADMLVGFRGRLFRIHESLQVAEVPYDYDAIGSGAQVAKGALHALMAQANLPLNARLDITTALEAAAEFQADVRGPFHIEVL